LGGGHLQSLKDGKTDGTRAISSASRRLLAILLLLLPLLLLVLAVVLQATAAAAGNAPLQLGNGRCSAISTRPAVRLRLLLLPSSGMLEPPLEDCRQDVQWCRKMLFVNDAS